MENSFYKNILYVIGFAWFIRSADLQCGSFESLTDPKPFISEKALREEYQKLGEREKKLVVNITAEKIETYYRDLAFFYKRLFRYIVKKDIENKLEYTIDLGFAIAKDGKLEMERLPTQDKYRENRYLLTLSIDPQNKKVIESLKNMFKQRANPSKNPSSFFPDIVILDNDSTEIDDTCVAEYDPQKNNIYICRKNFSIRAFLAMIHEFTHRLQKAQGCAKGGFCFGLLDSKAFYAKYPSNIALEIEAEIQSLLLMPDDNLALLEMQWDSPEKTLVELFPYFGTDQAYGFLLEHFTTLTHKQPYAKIGLKAYSERKCKEKNLIAICLKLAEMPEYEQNNCTAPACLELLKFGKEVEKLANKKAVEDKKKLLKELRLTKEQKEQIITAPNYPYGSPEFFKIKERICLKPK